MSYVDQVIKTAEEIRSSAPEGLAGKVLREYADLYEKENLPYAKDADAFNKKRDDIQLFLMGYELHKRQDLTGKTEYYCACIVGDNGTHKDDPLVHYHPSNGTYQQLEKGGKYDLRDPLVIYKGNPKGEMMYVVNNFDTQTSSHDTFVQVASSIISAAVELAVGAVGGPDVAAVGVAVEAANKEITKAAKDHDDELFAPFQGSLIEEDHFNKGPYSLASPKINLKTEEITVRLFVARVPDARKPSKPTKQQKPEAASGSGREGAGSGREGAGSGRKGAGSGRKARDTRSTSQHTR